MTRSQRRYTDYTKAVRKQDISKQCYGFEWYDNLHEYSKGKVHCGCCMCREKTNNKGRKHRHVWYPLINWKQSDRKKLESMKEEFDEYIGGDFVA